MPRFTQLGNKMCLHNRQFDWETEPWNVVSLLEPIIPIINDLLIRSFKVFIGKEVNLRLFVILLFSLQFYILSIAWCKYLKQILKLT